LLLRLVPSSWLMPSPHNLALSTMLSRRSAAGGRKVCYCALCQCCQSMIVVKSKRQGRRFSRMCSVSAGSRFVQYLVLRQHVCIPRHLTDALQHPADAKSASQASNVVAATSPPLFSCRSTAGAATVRDQRWAQHIRRVPLCVCQDCPAAAKRQPRLRLHHHHRGGRQAWLVSVMYT
jgi:hypothetical protein